MCLSLLIVLIETLVAPATVAYTINYFDCNDAKRIHRYRVNDLCEENNSGQNITKVYQLLQWIRKYDLEGYNVHCPRW